jgi:hypothetical protein
VMNDGESRVVLLFTTAEAGRSFASRFKVTDQVVNVGDIRNVLAFFKDLQGMNVHWATLNPVEKDDTRDRLSIAELVEVMQQALAEDGDPSLN